MMYFSCITSQYSTPQMTWHENPRLTLNQNIKKTKVQHFLNNTIKNYKMITAWLHDFQQILY